MPLTDVANVARLAVEGSLYSQQIVNVHHFQVIINDVPSVPDLAALDALTAAWRSNCQTAYLNCISNSYSLVKLSARTLISPTQVSEYSFPTPLPVGARTADANASQVAGIITWRTGYAGRRHRGRTYMPAPDESNLNAGRLTAALTGLMDTYAGTLLQFSTGIYTFKLVILSDPKSVLPNDPATAPAGFTVSYDFVTQHQSRDIPGTIRRRRIGVGG